MLIPRCLYTDWRGTQSEDHGLDRIKRGDTTDPQSDAMKSGQEERARASQNMDKDKAKSQATKERDQSHSKQQTEEEYPEAPRPIIGMNDERGRVSRSCALV